MNHYRRDDLEYADNRRRVLSPEQRAKFLQSWKRALAEGIVRGPLKVATARLLLAASLES